MESNRLVLAFALTLIAAGLTAAAPPRSIVKGRVLDAAGQPIQDAFIGMSSVGEPWTSEPVADEPQASAEDHFETTTDAEGRFQLDVPLPTSSWITFMIRPDELHGYAGRHFGRAGGRNQDPLREGVNDLGDFTLPSCGVIAGTVVDTEGVPVGFADVSLDGSFPGGYVVSGRADLDGTYRVGHVPEGTFDLECECEGYKTEKRARVAVRNGGTAEGIDFTLHAAPIISGDVVDPDGNPVANVRLWGWPVGSGSGAGARSGANGHFVIALPQDEPYTLEAELPGYAKYDEGHFSGGHPPGERGIRIVMQPLATAEFAVVDSGGGAPVERFGLRLIEVREGGHSSAEDDTIATSDHPGGLARAHADAALHDYQIEAPGYAPQQGRVVFDSPGGNRQTIRLVRGASVTGRVLFQGQPVEQASVHLEGTGIHQFPDSQRNDPMRLTGFTGRRRIARTAEDGSFTIGDLAAGSWVLECHVPSAAPFTRADIRVAPGETTDLGILEAVEGGTIQGKVVAKDGAAVAGLTIVLDDPWDARHDTEQITAADGSFRFEDVAAGRHELRIQAKDGDVVPSKPFPVEVATGATADVVLDVSAKVPARKGELSVRVELNGAPAAAVAVWTLSAEGPRGGFPERRGVTDDAGRLEFELVAAGSTLVEARSKAGLVLARSDAPIRFGPDGTSDVVLSAATGTLVVELPEGTRVPDGGSVRIALVDSVRPKGPYPPTFDAVVTVSRGGRNSPWEPAADIAWTDTRYELGAAPVGEHKVVVSGSVLAYSKTVIIEAGKTNVCKMTLDDAD